MVPGRTIQVLTVIDTRRRYKPIIDPLLTR
jgi:hypothetical protein